MFGEELEMFWRRKAKKWQTYVEPLKDASLHLGNRSTDRLHFLNVDEATLQEVKRAGEYVLPHVTEMVDIFYRNVLKDEYLHDLIKQHSTIDRLKGTLRRYLEQFFQGEINEQYIKTREKVGEVHSKINLSANYFLMGYSTILNSIHAILVEKLSNHPDEMMRLILAVNKLAAFDQQLIIAIYNEDTFKGFLHEISSVINDMTEIDLTADLIESMDEQMMEAHNVTAATEQMSSSIQEVSDHAVRVAEGTRDAVESAENSQQVINRALQDIEEVGNVYDIVMEDVNKLGKEIESTNDVIDVIKEIADQTNLLALNASIEAARAGEAGQGFAVVAMEVQKLSEHTKEQIKQITENMNTLQAVSRQVTQRIRETGESVDQSVQGSHQAGEELNNIISTMQSINEETTQIAAMSEEQSSTVIDISDRNTNMANLSEDVQQLAQATAKMIYDLSKQMDQYRQSFIDAQLIYNSEDIIKVAITDHLLWKWRIYNMMLGLEDISIQEVTSHRDCNLGRWYYGDLPREITNLSTFRALEEPHKKVHDCARRAVEQYQLGNTDHVKEILEQLEDASETVVQLLEKLQGEVSS